MDPIETFEREDGLTIEIHYDEYDGGHADPRDCDGNLGTMFCDYRGYTLGDEDAPDPREHEVECEVCEGEGVVPSDDAPVPDADGNPIPKNCDRCEGNGYYELSITEYLVREHGAKVILPLFVYEHSGITMRAGGNLLTGSDNMVSRDRFVGDAAGWDTSTVGVIFDSEATRKEWGCEDFPVEKIEENLKGEVEVYAAYLEGRVYGYRILDADGEELDSCWGFLEVEWDWEKTGVYEQATEQADYYAEQAKLEAIEAHRWACADVVTVA